MVVTVVDHGREEARGEKRLGNPQGFAGKVYREGGKARARMANGPLARRMCEEGLSLRDVAARLTTMGVRTARGGEWAAAPVKGVLDRLG